MRLVSLFLILAALFGVLTGTDSICLENHEKQVVAEYHTSSNSNNSAPDCHHEGSPHHTCHLGHCAFVVTNSLSGLIVPIQKILPPGYLATLPSNYPSSLFRPPIA